MQSNDETTMKELALLIQFEFGYWVSLHCVGKKKVTWLDVSWGRPTASWFDIKTKRSTSGGVKKIFMMILLTLCGWMKLQCNSKHTGGSAAGKRANIRSPGINNAQSTPSNSIFGVASASTVQQSSSYLTILWMLSCTYKSWKSAVFHF